MQLRACSGPDGLPAVARCGYLVCSMHPWPLGHIHQVQSDHSEAWATAGPSQIEQDLNLRLLSTFWMQGLIAS